MKLEDITNATGLHEFLMRHQACEEGFKFVNRRSLPDVLVDARKLQFDPRLRGWLFWFCLRLVGQWGDDKRLERLGNIADRWNKEDNTFSVKLWYTIPSESDPEYVRAMAAKARMWDFYTDRALDALEQLTHDPSMRQFTMRRDVW